VGIKDFGERTPTVALLGENETALGVGEGRDRAPVIINPNKIDDP
jgi:hypothetical protein